ncbi:MAG: hypothetical protein K2X27_28675 [Candidatus Obscuribacterales bacterium]|nr:hypothetical protein [Candidatus Obscuribacterales bacterium]
MAKIESASAISTPKWLLASTLIFLFLRCGLAAYENYNPPQASDEIHWRSPEKITEEDRLGRKLFFYNFSADWCDPCKKLDKTAFVSKDIVGLLERDFIPVRVIDRKKESGKNDSDTQELQDKYSVQAFPTLVAAMPGGVKISEHIGSLNMAALKKMLLEANAVADYFWGKEELIDGRFAAAANSFDSFLKHTRWHHWRAAFAGVFSVLAHRELGEEAASKKALKDALEHLHDPAFPRPILLYFDSKISYDELLKIAGENKSNRILCYAYTGLDFAREKDYERARKNFEWVLSNSVDKDSFEYRICSKALGRIESAKQSPPGS